MALLYCIDLSAPAALNVSIIAVRRLVRHTTHYTFLDYITDPVANPSSGDQGDHYTGSVLVTMEEINQDSEEAGILEFTWQSEKIRFHEYRHSPLAVGEVRLLRFSPGTSTSSASMPRVLYSFNISIQDSKLEGSPQYFALSYAWGDTKAIAPLFLIVGIFYPLHGTS